MPEEDHYLCVHEWSDMYEGAGVDQRDPYRVYQAFFCKKCLKIEVKNWSRARYKLSQEYLENFDEPRSESATA